MREGGGDDGQGDVGVGILQQVPEPLHPVRIHNYIYRVSQTKIILLWLFSNNKLKIVLQKLKNKMSVKSLPKLRSKQIMSISAVSNVKLNCL